MKHPFHCNILPYFTMGAGGLGLALRLWLFSAVDEKGLLPKGHPADGALYILSALVLGILFLATRQLARRHIRAKQVRMLRILACVAGGLSLVIIAFSAHSGSVIRLEGTAKVIRILGGLVLLVKALLAAAGKKSPYWLTALLTMALVANTVAQCQVWGSVPQLQEFFFPLLASVFLVFSAYYKTTLLAGQDSARKLAFFSQSALYFCCLSLNAEQWPLYLGMLFWAAVQLYPCILKKKEA
jgi:hypothetical protein